MSAVADAVIIGGGIQGLSVAWHLLRRRPGLRVVVLERLAATATQATGQAAALLTRLRSDRAVIPLVAATYGAIADLGVALGAPLPLHRVGTLHAAATPATARAVGQLAEIAVAEGLTATRPAAAEVARRLPWLDVGALTDWLAVPDEGFIDPYLLADAYARAARRGGADIRTGVAVDRLLTEGGRIVGVATANGTIATPVAIVAAGVWANRLTQPLGAALAMAPVRSQYWITEPALCFPADAPVAILADARAYARPELGALLFGLREQAAASADARSLGEDLGGYAFADDPFGWQALEEGAPALARLAPALPAAGIRHHVAGFSTYTPDGRCLAGVLPTPRGLLVASGCCGAGIATSGGIGEALAALAVGETPAVDITPFAADRFGAVDPDQPAFRRRCAAARAGKTAG